MKRELTLMPITFQKSFIIPGRIAEVLTKRLSIEIGLQSGIQVIMWQDIPELLHS